MIKRYNIIVSVLKISLLLVSLLCLFGIMFQYKSDNSINDVRSSSTQHLVNSTINVDHSLFTGTGTHSYKIFAEKVGKGHNEEYSMNNISGVYNLRDEGNITITSIAGTINPTSDKVTLDNDIKIGYENYVLLTEKLDIDFHKEAAKNNNYVEIIGERGKISADKFEANEKFNQILL
jgi:LPS export ABC transporter protein LptC